MATIEHAKTNVPSKHISDPQGQTRCQKPQAAETNITHKRLDKGYRQTSV